MSRFGNDDYDPQFPNQGELWWANIERHTKGKRGQGVLRELRDVLLAMPERRLISGQIADENGGVCAVGALALSRRCAKGESRDEVLSDLSARIGSWDDGADATASVGVEVGLVYGMAWQIGDLNDETFYSATPEERWERMLAWVESKIAVAA